MTNIINLIIYIINIYSVSTILLIVISYLFLEILKNIYIIKIKWIQRKDIK